MSHVGKRAIHVSVDSRIGQICDAAASACDPLFAENRANAG
jgi:hypothetical protein